MEREGVTMSPRFSLSARYGINTAVVVVLAIGIVGIIQALSYSHNWRKDFTENKRHSLSEESLKVLKNLSEPVKVTVFVQTGSPVHERVAELFGLYEYESKMVEVSMIDPVLHPNDARPYEQEIRRHGIPAAFFERGAARETVTQLDEEQVTNALIKVTRETKKRIYFLTGHGERSLEETEAHGLSEAKKLLEDKNYQMEPLLLLRREAVPDDCAALVVCGPQTPLAEPELEAIRDYLESGGRTAFFLDPETADSLKPFLEECGLTLGDDIVVDRLSRLFGGDYLTPVLTTYSPNHPITTNFNIASFFPVARSVSPQEVPGFRTSWLAKTGDGSWAETDLDALKAGAVTFDAGEDTRGPVALAAVSEEQPSGSGDEDSREKAGAVVVFGDSDFVTNGAIHLSGNANLFMNTMNWLGREEALIAIGPKERTFSPILLTPADARLAFLLPVVVLPGVVLVGALYIFIRRSRHP